MNPFRPHSQRGAALAVALVLLVVLTLLGIAALRATQTELKLTSNAEDRSAAKIAAESLIGMTLEKPEYIPASALNSFVACYTPASNAPPLAPVCTSPDQAITVDSSFYPIQAKSGYVRVTRVLPRFVSVNILRDSGLSGSQYQFARYAITAGVDRSQEGSGSAEISESRLVVSVIPVNEADDPIP